MIHNSETVAWYLQLRDYLQQKKKKEKKRLFLVTQFLPSGPLINHHDNKKYAQIKKKKKKVCSNGSYVIINYTVHHSKQAVDNKYTTNILSSARLPSLGCLATPLSMQSTLLCTIHLQVKAGTAIFIQSTGHSVMCFICHRLNSARITRDGRTFQKQNQ